MQDILLLSDRSRFLLEDDHKIENVNKDGADFQGVEVKVQIPISENASVKFLEKSIYIEGDESDPKMENSRLHKVAIQNILSIAASAERGSEHPLSKGTRRMYLSFLIHTNLNKYHAHNCILFALT